MTSNNVLLMTLAKLTNSKMFALASKYGIVQPLSGSINSIWAIVRRCLCDPRFSHICRTPTCDRQTDGLTDGRMDRHTMTAYTTLA